MAKSACASFPSMLLLAAALHLVTSPLPTAGSAPLSDEVHADYADSTIIAPRGPGILQIYTPLSYAITIEPDYQDPIEDTVSYDGEVKIEFQVTSRTDAIILYAGSGVDIDTDDISVLSGTTPLDTKTIAFAGETEVLTIEMTDNLKTSTVYTLTIKYTAAFQNDTRGFYKSTYKKDNETRVLFTTHFQPGHARKAFPCFDEPSKRAPFTLTIDVPEGYGALSNTPENLSTTLEDKSQTRIEFEETVSMPTYLVAFIVYEKSSFTPTHKVIIDDDVSITSWAHKEAVDNKLLEYSQEISFKILQNLEEFTGIKYGAYMRKLDQVAVPDFGAGAMENWGLVIYRQSRLFFNETSDSEATRKSVAAIIAHELTHQWFGNLVTTSTWDTTWLNEGFARYFQYLILSRLYPHWRMMDQLLLDQQMAIFVSDSINGQLPLTYDATTAEEISGRFGTITYSKGASIVRMISYIMGEKFQDGLQTYLKRGPSSVTPTNLFSDLETVLPADRKPPTSFETAMKPWIEEAGFPVVHLKRDYWDNTATFSQYRFFTDGTVETEANATTYNIPITWSSRDKATPQFFWLTDEFTLTDAPTMEYWMLVHANGYYRVNYDEANWLALSITMASSDQERVAPADRAKLVDDALALTHKGDLKYRVLSYLLRYLRTERDVLPWAAADRGLRRLELPLVNVDTQGVFHSFLLQATEAAYKALSGFSRRGDPPELILRAIVLEWACRAGSAQCLADAAQLLERFVLDKAPLDSNLEGVIRCYGTRNISAVAWEGLWTEYTATEDTTRPTLLKYLGCSRDSELTTLFNRIIREQFGGRKSEIRNAFQGALAHPNGISAAVDYVLLNMPEMRTRLPSEDIDNILRDLTDKLTSEEQMKRVNRFLEEQIEEDLMEEELVDSLQAKVIANVEEVAEYSKDALQAFADGASDKFPFNLDTVYELI